MEYDFTEDLKKKISDNIMSVKQSIEEAEALAGREKGSVTLIGVTKMFPVEYAELLISVRTVSRNWFPRSRDFRDLALMSTGIL